MYKFSLKQISNTDIEKELLDIGFDKSYIHKAKDKFTYKNIKIYDLSCAQANIIKQTALSVGADCATHREVITGTIDRSDCILGGSISQLEKISQKLMYQPFGLKDLGQQVCAVISDNIHTSTRIMGILNVTKDSFSDGGQFVEPVDAITHLKQLIDDGADVIDIGAESTRPYSEPVSVEEQLKKLLPILEYIKKENIKIPVSIDTRSSKVACDCIKLGASIINDVSGLDYDEKMVDVVSKYGVKIVIQHSKGTPDIMQNNPHYENLIDEIYRSLKDKVEYALSKGILRENIIVDPGIGFGKTREDNFKILRCWKEFKTLGCPVLIGLSRKSLLNADEEMSNDEKDMYTLALNSILMNDGVDYVRVHNVKIHKSFQNIIR